MLPFTPVFNQGNPGQPPPNPYGQHPNSPPRFQDGSGPNYPMQQGGPPMQQGGPPMQQGSPPMQQGANPWQSAVGPAGSDDSNMGIMLLGAAVILAVVIGIIAVDSGDGAEEPIAVAAQTAPMKAAADTAPASGVPSAAKMAAPTDSEPAAAPNGEGAIPAAAIADSDAVPEMEITESDSTEATVEEATISAGTGMTAAEMAELVAGSAPLRANGEEDRPADLVALEIKSIPVGAAVFRKRDNVQMCAPTPCTFEIGESSGNISFLVKMAGFRTGSITVPASTGGMREVILFPLNGKPMEVPTAVTPNLVTTPAEVAESVETPQASDVVPDVIPDIEPPPAAQRKRSKSRSKRAPRERTPRKKRSRGTKVDYTADSIPLD